MALTITGSALLAKVTGSTFALMPRHATKPRYP